MSLYFVYCFKSDCFSNFFYTHMNRTQINLEFIFKASPTILYKFLTTPTCLIRWFCEEVDNNGDVFTFVWNGAEEVATLVDDIEDERVRYVWEEAEAGEYLEFRMYKSNVTNETILEITDYCDTHEVKQQHAYWNSLIDEMRRAVGG